MWQKKEINWRKSSSVLFESATAKFLTREVFLGKGTALRKGMSCVEVILAYICCCPCVKGLGWPYMMVFGGGTSLTTKSSAKVVLLGSLSPLFLSPVLPRCSGVLYLQRFNYIGKMFLACNLEYSCLSSILK